MKLTLFMSNIENGSVTAYAGHLNLVEIERAAKDLGLVGKETGYQGLAISRIGGGEWLVTYPHGRECELEPYGLEGYRVKQEVQARFRLYVRHVEAVTLSPGGVTLPKPTMESCKVSHHKAPDKPESKSVTMSFTIRELAAVADLCRVVGGHDLLLNKVRAAIHEADETEKNQKIAKLVELLRSYDPHVAIRTVVGFLEEIRTANL